MFGGAGAGAERCKQTYRYCQYQDTYGGSCHFHFKVIIVITMGLFGKETDPEKTDCCQAFVEK